MTTKEKIEVMKAYAEGKKIQVREIGAKDWSNWGLSLEPDWNWLGFDYRIKPEEKYRPYKDTEEMIEDFKKRFNAKVPPYAMPMIWVRNKTFKDCRLITVFRGKVVMIIVSGEDMKELFKDYTYLDGSPCGIKEQ